MSEDKVENILLPYNGSYLNKCWYTRFMLYKRLFRIDKKKTRTIWAKIDCKGRSSVVERSGVEGRGYLCDHLSSPVVDVLLWTNCYTWRISDPADLSLPDTKSSHQFVPRTKSPVLCNWFSPQLRLDFFNVRNDLSPFHTERSDKT